jgi:hypothetical protein
MKKNSPSFSFVHFLFDVFYESKKDRERERERRHKSARKRKKE